MSGRKPTGPQRRRTGRRPGPSTTREQIVAAARESFAERGYDATSLRAVALKAGVDPALVARFFGSKENLLTAALEETMRPADGLAGALEGDLDTLGERLIAYMLTVWEAPTGREVMVGMIRSACTNDRAAQILRDFISAQVLARLGSKLDPGEAQLRASLVGSQIVGLALYRYVVQIEPLSSAPPETLSVIFGPTLQRYLTGDI